METYYSHTKEERKLYRLKNKEKLKAYQKEYSARTKEKRKEYRDSHKEEKKEKRQKKRYWIYFHLIQRFNTSMKGYVPQYELQPEAINENRVFTKEDFEYIKQMSNFKYPSLEDNKQTSLQKYNIKVKYENL